MSGTTGRLLRCLGIMLLEHLRVRPGSSAHLSRKVSEDIIKQRGGQPHGIKESGNPMTMRDVQTTG